MEPAGEGSTILISDPKPVKPIYEAGIGRGFTRTNADQKRGTIRRLRRFHRFNRNKKRLSLIEVGMALSIKPYGCLGNL